MQLHWEVTNKILSITWSCQVQLIYLMTHGAHNIYIPALGAVDNDLKSLNSRMIPAGADDNDLKNLNSRMMPAGADDDYFEISWKIQMITWARRSD